MKDNHVMSTKIKILYLALAILIVYTLWPSGGEQQEITQAAIISENEQGEMTVFGVVLGKTTLGEAEIILGSRAKRALFIMPPEIDEQGNELIPEHNVEAFFPSLPDNSKMLLGLHSKESELEQIRYKAHGPIAFPSGNIKLEIDDQQQAMVNNMPVITLTSIPRIKLGPEDISNKFGEPALVHVQEEILHFLYPKIGLDVILDKSGEALLQFVEPSKFSQVLSSLDLDKEALTNPDTLPQEHNNEPL